MKICCSIKKRVDSLLQSADNVQLIKNVIGNYAVKGGSMVISLLMMPAYMNYFYSDTLLGMWFTVASLVSWLMMLDFGVGGGIRNQLVEPLHNGNAREIKEILSAGYFTVGGIVVLLLFAQHFVVEWINWYPILGIQRGAISETTLKLTIHILVIGVCIRFFTVLVAHVLYAMQKATLPSILILVSNVLILLYMLIAQPSGKETDIIALAIVQAMGTNLPIVIVMIVLFATKLKGAFPSPFSFKFSRAKMVLEIGGSLFYLQCLIALVFGVKELFISWFVGAEQVVDYQVYYKLIGMISGLFSLALTPVWSAVTKAYIEKNYTRIRKLYVTAGKTIFLFSIGQLLLLTIMPWVVKLWLGENTITVSYQYGLIFCFYNVIYMFIMLNYNFACGMGKTKVISIGLTVALLINVLLAYWWCDIFASWVTVVAATAVASMPCVVFATCDIYKTINNRNGDKSVP